MVKKICNKCGCSKYFSQFHKNSKRDDNLTAQLIRIESNSFLEQMEKK